MKRLKFIFFLFLIECLLGCQNQTFYKEERVLLGTYVEIIAPKKEAIENAFSEIKRIEVLLNKYDPNSEVSRLNREGKLKLSKETFYVIRKAKEFWQKTEGAFDITVEPLLEIWGFLDKNYRIPTPEEIKGTLELVGADKILLNEVNQTAEFQKKGMRIDLGGIAKGYAVDMAVRKLKEMGIENALINAGGDIYCLGDKAKKLWKVGIKEPQNKGLRKIIYLKDKAIATSGDYEQYFKNQQKKYCHIFDPKKGYPIDSGMVSVTVSANDCLTADALATAIMVLGVDKGKELVKNWEAKIEDFVLAH